MNEKTPLNEITIKAIVLGIALSVVLAGANAYLGLFAGMTVSASIPAAVVSMGLLKLFRKSNILENNIVQTAASAGESLAAGVIFTLPALILLDYWTEFDYLWVTLIASLGGVLGVLFTIPLRRALIIEADLKFPEGIATAEVLKAGDKQDSASGIKHIVFASLAGGLFKLASGGLKIFPEAFATAARCKSSILYFGSNLSPALLSVGYIVGLNIASLIFIGGLMNWLVAIPICASQVDWPMVDGAPLAAVDFAGKLWEDKTRYIGVGAMLVGGLWTIVQMRSSLFAGIASGLGAYKNLKADSKEVDRTEKDIPLKWIMILIIASAVPIFLLYQAFVANVAISLPMAVMMLLLGFLFSAVAGYMAGIVGSSNNPISGVTIATVLVSSLLLLLLMGRDAPNGPAAAIIIGSVVCCAAAIAGDNMQDLKAGRIVGATPYKQQIMQIVGTISSALVIAPILMLLLKAYGFAGHASAVGDAGLDAPQANLMKAVAEGVFTGNLPWSYIFIGMGVAIVIILIDLHLKKIGSSFRTPVLAVAIGFYLPFRLAVPIFVGGFISHALKRYYEKRKLSPEKPMQQGLLFASGLITGEALIGIFMAIPIVISGNKGILAVCKGMLNEHVATGLGIVLLVAIAAWLYKTAMPNKSEK